MALGRDEAALILWPGGGHMLFQRDVRAGGIAGLEEWLGPQGTRVGCHRG